MTDETGVVYWDASAILSVLFKDRQSDHALKWAHRSHVHFISTLAQAEVCAVIMRLKREHHISAPLVKVSHEALDQGPWRRLVLEPEWGLTQELSQKWNLRGADLWHLATAKTLQKELPELMLLTFDSRLAQSAEGEGLRVSDNLSANPPAGS
jgi:predicted nucleic acid-binding protein